MNIQHDSNIQYSFKKLIDVSIFHVNIDLHPQTSYHMCFKFSTEVPETANSCFRAGKLQNPSGRWSGSSQPLLAPCHASSNSDGGDRQASSSVRNLDFNP